MAIVKMRKLNLVAMSYDKGEILNALQKTGAVEVTLHEETENTVVLPFGAEELKAELSSLEASLFSLSSQVENFEKENGIRSGVLKDGFEIPYAEFISAGERKEEMRALATKINALTDKRNERKATLSKVSKEKNEAKIYENLRLPFTAFAPTAHTHARLGLVATNTTDGLRKALEEKELCACEVLQTTAENALLFVSAHRSVTADADGVLSTFGFTDCPYANSEKMGKEIYLSLVKQEEGILRDLQENEYAMYELKEYIRPLKVYCDYLSFALEKEELSEKLRATQSTFLLQAYLPEDAEEIVREALQNTRKTMWTDFSDPSEDDTPPTLLRNNAIVSNFESITNTYAAPNYREFDPNAVMSFFYSLFMGFIIGDAGYGFLMAAVGGWLWWKNRARPTGTSKMAGAFAVGGVFAILWGALFNSFFGFALLGVTVMPNPQNAMWSLAGISVPAVLVISMELGVFQLCAGYLCKAVQAWRRGQVSDGICDGVIWAIFSVGIGLAIIGFVDEAGVPKLGTIGGIVAGVSLLLAMLTAGRHEKFFGKFTKGFGAAYGVINYASDILSYARLYGLMLSGSVIAGIIAQYSGQFLASGSVPMILLAVVLLVVGHGFNLVMNLLGAYIHDARLQYVEFYGRFFEGEGELFKPLGSEHKYVYVLPEQEKKAA